MYRNWSRVMRGSPSPHSPFPTSLCMVSLSLPQSTKLALFNAVQVQRTNFLSSHFLTQPKLYTIDLRWSGRIICACFCSPQVSGLNATRNMRTDVYIFSQQCVWPLSGPPKGSVRHARSLECTQKLVHVLTHALVLHARFFFELHTVLYVVTCLI